MSPRPPARRAVATAVGVLALVGALSGCSRELVQAPGQGGPAVASDPTAARAKLTLLLADPCATAPDPDRVWTRCGRWVEEAASTGRAASAAVGGTAVDTAVAGIGSAHDAFLARGCGSAAATVPGGGAVPCVAALQETRTAVAALAQATGVAP